MRGTIVLLVIPASIVVGCGVRTPPAAPLAKKAAKTSAKHANEDVKPAEKGSTAAKPNGQDRQSWHEPADTWLPPLGTASGAPLIGPGGGTWAGGQAFTDSQAAGRIERELKDALLVRPTVIVWLFDQSAAAGAMRRAMLDAALQMPRRLSDSAASPTSNGSSASTPHKLLTGIVAFGGRVNVITPQPISDPENLSTTAIAEEPSAATQTLAALTEAAKRFSPYRMRGHEVVFVLVAHSAAEDEANYAAAVEILVKAAIPVFAVGPASPFGRLADSMTADLRPIDSSVGLESRHAERIKLFFPDNQGDAELTDAGFGPFHLERVCRATNGALLRIRPNGSPGWATADNGEIKAELLRKYAPDYGSEEEYKKILADNRACMALHEAAKLPPARVLIVPTSDFHKDDEAKMSRALSQAQEAAAVPQQALERLQQALAAGEGDRPKLTRPRWQAAYDLAFGRACAARARNDGYNYMLAVLKNGKTFAKPESTIWSLKPADGIGGNSGLDKMAKNAKTYLERVVKEHTGTPWAAMAARELETPCGWEWTER
jgi:hypothetical protein